MPAKKLSDHDLVFGDLDRELEVTRTVLERLPEEKFGWTPHEKSMKLGRLAMHVATIPEWALITLNDSGLDMAAGKRPRTEPNDKKDLLETFDKAAKDLREAVKKFDAGTIGDAWTIRNGAQVMASK